MRKFQVCVILSAAGNRRSAAIKTFLNPILPGFHPDPCLCRVGDDYYLVTSTFEYFPGLPVYHSRDLVHWRPIGHVIQRPAQLALDGVPSSGGLFAATIRHHADTFYVVNTLVHGQRESGNFIVSARHPAGPWSDPVWLKDAPGIDPSLFFDNDGRCWFSGNLSPEQKAYRGHRAIWLQELNLNTMQLTGKRHILWDGAANKAMYTEAPHIYKRNGTYYLVVAEGGTFEGHGVAVLRSRSVTGPYEPHPENPILTHRNRPQHPVGCTGHADLVETQNGEWWAVLLATRPYGGNFYNLGRETFLAPVVWQNDWPVLSPQTGALELEYPAPGLPEQQWPKEPARDDFDYAALHPRWNFLRTPRENFWSLRERPGYLRLHLRPEQIEEPETPSFIGRRQQHINFEVSAQMEFVPARENECAGLVLLQSNYFHFRFVVTQSSHRQCVRLVRRQQGEDNCIGERPLSGSRFIFKITAAGQDYSFYITGEDAQWFAVAENVDGRALSTTVAGGFVGTYIGMYASSNSLSSENVADFAWFEYRGT